MDLYGATKTKYDVPLNHLDFAYIKSCENKKELEKIVKILRSGKEGTYPDLEACAEKQLASLDPGNKLLRKPDTLKTSRDISKEEWKEIDDELKDWMADVKSSERNLEAKQCVDVDEDDDNLPPIRSVSQQNHAVKKPSQDNEARCTNDSKRVKPRDYREWDKIDVDAELKKLDEEDTASPSKETQTGKSPKSAVADRVETAGLSDELKEMKAEREKNKGNEAFRAGDFEEALTYYSRSLSLLKTVAAHNNRAQTYIKLKQWNKALDDCEAVLSIEPTNMKAVMRRAVANKGLTRYVQAKQDLKTVLEKEPANKQALAVMKEVEKALADQKVSGRRMVIEEVEGSDEDEDQSTQSTAGKSLSNGLETSDHHTEKTVNSTDARPVQEALSDDSKQQYNLQKCEDITAGGDATAAAAAGGGGGGGTETSSHTQPLTTQGDPAASPDDNLPPAALALKDSGNDLFRKGQYGDALDKYNTALQLLEGSSNAGGLSVLYSNRAACLMKLGDCQGCIADCDSALSLCSNSPKPLLRRAMAFEALEKYRKAFVDYRVVLSLGSNVDVAQQGSDRCGSMLQQIDGPRWREKLPSIPSSSSLSSLTSSSSANDMVGSNETTFETCKAEGNALFSKGEFTKAMELFTMCIELFPDRVVPFTNRALCYLRLKEYESVLSDCNQALSLEFHNVKALFRRAQAYKMLQRYEESMIDLETLLKIDPSNSAAKKELQLVLRSKEDEREKRLQACLRKHRQRVHIEEVDESSDEEDTGGSAVPCTKKVSLGHASGNTAKSTESTADCAGNAVDSAVISSGQPDDSSLASVTMSSSSVPVSNSFSPPQLSKVTAFEFMQVWNGLKGTSDIEQYLSVLDQIQPSDIPKVISNKLDSDLLMLLVRCCSRLILRGDHCSAFEFLRQVSTLPRFDTIALFLSDAEKKEVEDVFHRLAELCEDHVLVGKTKQKYGL